MMPYQIRQDLAKAGSSLDCQISMRSFEVFAERQFKSIDQIMKGHTYEFVKELLRERVRITLYVRNSENNSVSLNFTNIKVREILT